MKKLLAAVLTVATFSAIASEHNMVRFYGWDGGDRTQSFDFSMSGNDADKAKADQNIALNYARAFGQWQVGITYKSMTSTVDGDSSGSVNAQSSEISYDNGTTTGLSVYYNSKSDLKNTCYFAFHYNMTAYTADSVSFTDENGTATNVTTDTDASLTEMALEYGHRWAVGSAWGFNLTYAPSVAYTMGTWSFDANGVDDIATTDLSWNFLKFDVLF